MSRITADDLLVRASSALWREVADGVVVLGPDARKPRLITGPASRVWSLVTQPVAFGDVVAALALAHHTPAAVVSADLEPVIGALRRDGAVELVT
jgi:hypothetical protein